MSSDSSSESSSSSLIVRKRGHHFVQVLQKTDNDSVVLQKTDNIHPTSPGTPYQAQGNEGISTPPSSVRSVEEVKKDLLTNRNSVSLLQTGVLNMLVSREAVFSSIISGVAPLDPEDDSKQELREHLLRIAAEQVDVGGRVVTKLQRIAPLCPSSLQNQFREVFEKEGFTFDSNQPPPQVDPDAQVGRERGTLSQPVVIDESPEPGRTLLDIVRTDLKPSVFNKLRVIAPDSKYRTHAKWGGKDPAAPTKPRPSNPKEGDLYYTISHCAHEQCKAVLRVVHQWSGSTWLEKLFFMQFQRDCSSLSDDDFHSHPLRDTPVLVPSTREVDASTKAEIQQHIREGRNSAKILELMQASGNKSVNPGVIKAINASMTLEHADTAHSMRNLDSFVAEGTVRHTLRDGDKVFDSFVLLCGNIDIFVKYWKDLNDKNKHLEQPMRPLLFMDGTGGVSNNETGISIIRGYLPSCHKSIILCCLLHTGRNEVVYQQPMIQLMRYPELRDALLMVDMEVSEKYSATHFPYARILVRYCRFHLMQSWQLKYKETWTAVNRECKLTFDKNAGWHALKPLLDAMIDSTSDAKYEEAKVKVFESLEFGLLKGLSKFKEYLDVNYTSPTAKFSPSLWSLKDLGPGEQYMLGANMTNNFSESGMRHLKSVTLDGKTNLSMLTIAKDVDILFKAQALEAKKLISARPPLKLDGLRHSSPVSRETSMNKTQLDAYLKEKISLMLNDVLRTQSLNGAAQLSSQLAPADTSKGSGQKELDVVPIVPQQQLLQNVTSGQVVPAEHQLEEQGAVGTVPAKDAKMQKSVTKEVSSQLQGRNLKLCGKQKDQTLFDALFYSLFKKNPTKNDVDEFKGKVMSFFEERMINSKLMIAVIPGLNEQTSDSLAKDYQRNISLSDHWKNHELTIAYFSMMHEVTVCVLDYNGQARQYSATSCLSPTPLLVVQVDHDRFLATAIARKHFDHNAQVAKQSRRDNKAKRAEKREQKKRTARKDVQSDVHDEDGADGSQEERGWMKRTRSEQSRKADPTHCDAPWLDISLVELLQRHPEIIGWEPSEHFKPLNILIKYTDQSGAEQRRWMSYSSKLPFAKKFKFDYDGFLQFSSKK